MKLTLKVSIFALIIVTACETKNQESKPTTNKPIELVETPKTFDYQPQSPINGELNAVIELGSLGLNYFIIDIDRKGRWILKGQKFGRSNIIYGADTSNEIIGNIMRFKEEIIGLGVDESKIFLVASSSVVENNNINLIEAISNVGIPLKTVSPEEEAKYAMIATIPREFVDESFLVDIGSGKTKISWVNDADTSTIEIYGSKYFLDDVQDTTVFREVRNALLKVPEENRNLCFMLGGIVYEFSKAEVSNTNRRYHVMSNPDEYPTYNEKFKAGRVIYNALYLPSTYSYIFDSYSNFSIGYLVSQKK
ncbi:Ppx/GppA phosphatase family protein [Ekhidna lutea]|uniref:Ppx/GppA phosphatase family protein n=1 Tax=Ekhidna lutea TaxID=447679 RepID=A0A239H489_EKHLU|nr:hypothetical protein [Ekhidna lutea]SNS76229.1 Ppx/GppA phosphatase family protein [Ekhidna lutea]